MISRHRRVWKRKSELILKHLRKQKTQNPRTQQKFSIGYLRKFLYVIFMRSRSRAISLLKPRSRVTKLSLKTGPLTPSFSLIGRLIRKHLGHPTSESPRNKSNKQKIIFSRNIIPIDLWKFLKGGDYKAPDDFRLKIILSSFSSKLNQGL